MVPALLAGPAAAQVFSIPKAGVAPDRCAPAASKTAGAKAVGPGKLGEEPPAAQVLTVYRTDETGCPQPVVLRRGLGANPDKAVPIAGAARLRPLR